MIYPLCNAHPWFWYPPAATTFSLPHPHFSLLLQSHQAPVRDLLKSEFVTANSLTAHDLLFIHCAMCTLYSASPFPPLPPPLHTHQSSLPNIRALYILTEDKRYYLYETSRLDFYHRKKANKLNNLAYFVVVHVSSGDEFASLFLINHGATINAATHQEMQTPLHMTAGFSTNSDSHNVVQNMVIVTELLLQKGANTGQQDFQGK